MNQGNKEENQVSDTLSGRRKGISIGRRVGADEAAEISSGSEIIKTPFPVHRTVHLIPSLDSELPSDEHVDIVVTQDVLLCTFSHVSQDTSRELGGFLLGNVYECPNSNRQYVVIDQYMEANYTEGTNVSLTFTTESWGQLKDRLDSKYRGKSLVGWYHSHPGMGIFLSTYDVAIHKNRFAGETDVALVIDPIKHEGGFFARQNGELNPRELLDFYELLESDQRETVVAWNNYEAEDPKTKQPAPLAAVSTQGANVSTNGTGAKAKTDAKNLLEDSPLGELTKKPAFLVVAGLVAVLFLGGVLLLGWRVLSWLRPAPANTNSEVVASTNSTSGKLPKPSRIKFDLTKETAINDEGKLTAVLKVLGIGRREVVEEVRNNPQTGIDIDATQATIANTEVDNDGNLIVTATADLSEDKLSKFLGKVPIELPVMMYLVRNDTDSTEKGKTFYLTKGDDKTSIGWQTKVAKTIELANEDDAPRKTRPLSKPRVEPPVVVAPRPEAKPGKTPGKGAPTQTPKPAVGQKGGGKIS